jgi:hypothetical protein
MDLLFHKGAAMIGRQSNRLAPLLACIKRNCEAPRGRRERPC